LVSASRRYARLGVWLGHVGSAPPRLGVNLLLVPVGSLYRPALPISQRTELATAFAHGEAARAPGPAQGEERWREVMELSADERGAYQLGLAGPEGLQAPASLAFAVALLLAEGVAQTTLRVARPRWQKLGLISAYFAVGVYAQRVHERARVRRGRALGLTPDTAPRPASMGLVAGQFAGRFVLIGIQQARVRRRVGRWARVSASSIVAATAIRELRLRQSWRAAYRRRQPSA
jgi:hypothetical protein